MGSEYSTDNKTLQGAHTYIGLDGRELDINDVIARGTFRVTVKPGTKFIMWAVGIAVYVALYILITPQGFHTYHALLGFIINNLVYIFITPFYFKMIVNLMRSGREYNYRADGRVFVVTSEGISDEYFFYKDVQSVTYKEMKFLWFAMGYEVEILTRRGITKYNYVFPGLGRHHSTMALTSTLPFEVIRERIGQKQRYL